MTRMLPTANGRARCIVCDRPFEATRSPLGDWSMCSIECADRDRDHRYQAPRPEGDEDEAAARIAEGPPFGDELRPWIDFLEERRQRDREERLQVALVMRHVHGRSVLEIPTEAWITLAEAELGNFRGRAIATRIGELVEAYAERPAELRDLDPEGVRRRLWAMVPIDLARQIA
jgi:hypothetical protein